MVWFVDYNRCAKNDKERNWENKFCYLIDNQTIKILSNR